MFSLAQPQSETQLAIAAFWAGVCKQCLQHAGSHWESLLSNSLNKPLNSACCLLEIANCTSDGCIEDSGVKGETEIGSEDTAGDGVVSTIWGVTASDTVLDSEGDDWGEISTFGAGESAIGADGSIVGVGIGASTTGAGASATGTGASAIGAGASTTGVSTTGIGASTTGAGALTTGTGVSTTGTEVSTTGTGASTTGDEVSTTGAEVSTTGAGASTTGTGASATGAEVSTTGTEASTTVTGPSATGTGIEVGFSTTGTGVSTIGIGDSTDGFLTGTSTTGTWVSTTGVDVSTTGIWLTTAGVWIEASVAGVSTFGICISTGAGYSTIGKGWLIIGLDVSTTEDPDSVLRGFGSLFVGDCIIVIFWLTPSLTKAGCVLVVSFVELIVDSVVFIEVTLDLNHPQLDSQVEFNPIFFHWSIQNVFHSQGHKSMQAFLPSKVGNRSQFFVHFW